MNSIKDQNDLSLLPLSNNPKLVKFNMKKNVQSGTDKPISWEWWTRAFNNHTEFKNGNHKHSTITSLYIFEERHDPVPPDFDRKGRI